LFRQQNKRGVYPFLFKQEFTDAPHWMHLDIAGVGGVVDGSNVPYLAKGMN